MLTASPREIRRIELLGAAHHEIGHAVVLVDGGVPIVSVDLFVSGRGSNRPYWGRVDVGLEAADCSRKQLHAYGVCTFAGAEAEAHFLTKIGFDRSVATELAYSGAGDDLDYLRGEVLPRLRVRPDVLQAEAARAVQRQWPRIGRLAERLAKRMRLGPHDLA